MTSNDYQISAMRICMESCHNEELAYELGDVRWFVALLSLLLGYTDEKIEQMNIEKLKDRAMRNVIIGEGDNR